MIQNLAAYNAWQRSTLDRTAARYRLAFVRVFANHLASLGYQMEKALKARHNTISVSFDKLPDLEKVLMMHAQHTIKVGVSNGYREITPEKKLSTWTQWPAHIPCEDTFTAHNPVALAEKKKRDGYADQIYKKLRQRAKSIVGKQIDLERARYLKNVESVFKNLADAFYKNPEDDTTEDIIKRVIKTVFDKTTAQAETIFRTETTRYFNDARIEYFQDATEVDFIQLVAVTDGRVSAICESRDMYVVPIGQAGQKKFKPPFHPNCRTIQSPLDTDLKSDAEEVRKNLGAEFGAVKSETSDKTFTGHRQASKINLPKGWV